MANDRVSTSSGNAGTPTTRLKHGPYPKGPLGENPANAKVVSAGDTVNAPAHEAAQAASASIRLGQLRALHAAAMRQGDTQEAARLNSEIALLEEP